MLVSSSEVFPQICSLSSSTKCFYVIAFTQQQCNEIEKIQLEAGRIVTGATKLVEIDKLYKELGWLTLSERRDLHNFSCSLK